MTLFYDLLVKFGPPIKVDDLGFCLIIQASEFDLKWEAELTNLGYTCSFEQLDDYPAVLVPIKRTITEAAADPTGFIDLGAPVKVDIPIKIDEAEVLIDIVGKIGAFNEEILLFRKLVDNFEKQQKQLGELITSCQEDLAKIKNRQERGLFH